MAKLWVVLFTEAWESRSKDYRLVLAMLFEDPVVGSKKETVIVVDIVAGKVSGDL